jgi:histidinol dehydrogenase
VLRRLDASGALAESRAATAEPDDAVRDAVRSIIAAVRADGDAALRRYTEQFDGCRIDTFAVAPEATKAALDALDPELRSALELAAGRIRTYHEAQAAVPGPAGIDRDGVRVTEMVRPVDRAGLYVPGGRAAYPSTVLMTAIPASVAGVGEIALCVPPAADGLVPEVTLAAAALAGVDEVYAVGGAQAIAALAYGTESIPRVDVIVGPGNAYVSWAKREVAGAGAVGIESPAGPSELLIVADATAPPAYLAADLVAQAEHGPGGAVLLVTDDEAVAAAVDAEIVRALAELPAARRAEAESTLDAGGRAVIVRDLDEALAVANAFAPEHLELVTADPEALLPLVRNAGAVFVGPDAPTAYGDYVAGANHVLPTSGAARFSSALRVDDFRTHVHVVRADAEAARGPVARAGQTIAAAEGLDAHARSIRIRGGGS